MGVSCVGRLLASAVAALGAAGCAVIPSALDPPATDSVAIGAIEALAQQARAQKCHEALVKAAEPYGLTKALTSRLSADDATGPIWVTMVYRRRGGAERRSALIDCHLDESGNVAALTEH